MIIFIVDLLLIIKNDVKVDYKSYSICILVGSSFIALGQVYRHTGRSDKIAPSLIASGNFILFTTVASASTYLLLPVDNFGFDHFLASIDYCLGYEWIWFVSWFDNHALLGFSLAVIYGSSLIQMVSVILLLGLRGKVMSLHRFLATGVLSFLFGIAIWALLPSFGPSAIIENPSDISRNTFLVVGAEYGMQLRRVAHFGVSRISPHDALGLIAFPSFHAIMAMMVIVFSRGFGKLFYLYLPLNILMFPAILLHGGHHLVDVFAGITVFLVAHALVCWWVPSTKIVSDNGKIKSSTVNVTLKG